MSQQQISLGPPERATTVLWKPMSGATVQHLRGLLLESKELPNPEAWERIEASSTAILGRCLPPTQTKVHQRTGLVVGYVQSGKTMSMTSVAALARDNGFGLVVILAGTKENLLNQSWERFKKYLTVTTGPMRPWYMDTTDNHKLEKNKAGLKNLFESWKPEQSRPSAFVVAMKNHSHLDQLATVLEFANAKNIPALVIDDEADQASMNTTPKKGVPSTTYGRINRLRAVLGPHSYLQYTATPQAPLLISIADQLSPDFSEVLDPGDGYTGGKTFFVDERDNLVKAIPTDDLFSTGSPPQEPPDSLLQALREFLVGVALAGHNAKTAGKNRSMLVHPSPQNNDHRAYYNWTNGCLERWKQAFRMEPSDPDVADLKKDFEPAIVEMRRTTEVPDFDVLFLHLRQAADYTLVHEVNSETGTEVEWTNAYAHILVGGQKLNRGYTVEGLAVTYMPRGPGTWTADTIQQLARFFGYKKSYLPVCRLHLHPDLIEVFQAYVDHEEDLRTQLRAHPGPLQEWARTLYLHDRMRPTRHQVLLDSWYRIDPNEWIQQSMPFDETILEANKKLLASLKSQLEKLREPHEKAPTKHDVAVVGLKELAETFLYEYRFVGEHDTPAFYAARHVIAGILSKYPKMRAAVVFSRDKKNERAVRGNQLVKLFQGVDRKDPAKYPGASAIFDPEMATVQIYELDLSFEDEKVPVVKSVPTIAIRLPKTEMTKSVMHQPTRRNG